MKISDVSVPDVYKESGDFRFFLRWFEDSLTRIQYDTENMPDLYDPIRCPDWLLWMLADTMGFKFDDRLPTAFNRLVLVYFMSMIRNKGSKDGVTLAAETNLAQFNIIDYGKENEILNNRLEDTSIPVNSVYVTPHVAEGYIDVVYFSTKKPIDACIEYVRPVGMYLIQQAGVRMDARGKISVDARLTNTNELGVSIGPTFVGHYSRADYASLQRIKDEAEMKTIVDDPRYSYEYDKDSGKTRRQQYKSQRSDRLVSHNRRDVWYRNSKGEGEPTPNESSEWINPGLRAMYSLQLCNNEHIVNSLLKPIFGLGYLPQDVDTYDPDNIDDTYVLPDQVNLDSSNEYYPGKYPNAWNLRYDKLLDEEQGKFDIWTIEEDRTESVVKPRPAVNPVMSSIGDAMAINSSNTQYFTDSDTPGEYEAWKVKTDGDLYERITDPADIDED